MQRNFLVQINEEVCKGCALCVEACPEDVLALKGSFNSKGWDFVYPKNPDACTGCLKCVFVCPDVAINVYLEQREEVEVNG